MGELGAKDSTWASLGLSIARTSKPSSRLALISSLRSKGIVDHIDLPQLVVCGDQSAGKSSVLEGVTSIPFPRQDGLCTRFATEIILEHFETETDVDITASIIPGALRDDVSREQLRSYSRHLDAFSELAIVISEVAELMGLTGSSAATFGQDVLRIKVSGNTGLNLTVVDLPSLISVPNEEQTDADVETVHALVDSYAANPRTIVLAVVQAGNDIANQPIIQKSKKFDRKGERTVGIITKPDLLNEGTQGRIATLARNEDTTKLKLGFFIVKNPAPTEVEAGVSLEERERSESAYFSSPPWNLQRLDPERVGICSLRRYLQELLDQHTEREMPKVREDIRTLLRTTEKNLNMLGEERPTPAHVRIFLSRLAMRFHAIATSALQGDYDGSESQFFNNDEGRYRRLRAFIHIVNTEYSNDMRCRGETFKITNGDKGAIQDEDELKAALNGQEHPGQLKVTEAVFKIWIKTVYTQTRGRELPGNYNHALLGELFHVQSRRWQEMAESHIQNVFSNLRTFVGELSGQITNEEQIGLEINEIIGRRLAVCMETAEKELQVLLSDEEQQPITYNHYYTDNVQKSRQDESKDLIKKLIRQTTSEDMNGVFHISNNGSDLERLITALQNRVVVDMDEQACLEARTGLSAYYKVARKTFVDNVCKQVIERHLVRPLPTLFSPEIIAGYSDDELMRIAAELPQTSSRRKTLQKLCQDLMGSLAELG